MVHLPSGKAVPTMRASRLSVWQVQLEVLDFLFTVNIGHTRGDVNCRAGSDVSDWRAMAGMESTKIRLQPSGLLSG